MIPSQGISYRPICKKFRAQKCVTGDEVTQDGRVWHEVDGITITDHRANWQHWCEVLDVSDDCEVLTKESIGGFVWIPEFKPNHMYPVPGSDHEWVIRDSIFNEKDVPAMVVYK